MTELEATLKLQRWSRKMLEKKRTKEKSAIEIKEWKKKNKKKSSWF